MADEQILTTTIVRAGAPRWPGARNLPRGRPGPVGRRRAGDGPGPRQLIVGPAGRGAYRRARAGARVGPSGFRVLYETSGRYLRVVRVGTEDWLLEQDAGETEPFEPDIRRLVWDGERFRTVRLRLPRGVSIYGLALWIRLSGSPDPDGRLHQRLPAECGRLRGQRLWTSSDALGGSAVTFEFFSTGRAVNQQAGDQAWPGSPAGWSCSARRRPRSSSTRTPSGVPAGARAHAPVGRDAAQPRADPSAALEGRGLRPGLAEGRRRGTSQTLPTGTWTETASLSPGVVPRGLDLRHPEPVRTPEGPYPRPRAASRRAGLGVPGVGLGGSRGPERELDRAFRPVLGLRRLSGRYRGVPSHMRGMKPSGREVVVGSGGASRIRLTASRQTHRRPVVHSSEAPSGSGWCREVWQ